MVSSKTSPEPIPECRRHSRICQAVHAHRCRHLARNEYRTRQYRIRQHSARPDRLAAVNFRQRSTVPSPPRSAWDIDAGRFRMSSALLSISSSE